MSEKRNILITGATGNIGTSVLSALDKLDAKVKIIAGVRSVNKGQKRLEQYSSISFRNFDFEQPTTFSEAFDNIDVLFLLRPPHISEVERYFRPLLTAAKKKGIEKIVFLSVQGAEKSNIIPHHKIERLIKELNFDWIFVRPSYFMQNLTTTLANEIKVKNSITLPSGNAKFNWVDVENIGEASAQLLLQFETYKNNPFEITGTENENFETVAKLLSTHLHRTITYKRINPFCFYFKKKKEGISSGFSLVMTLLHFLPRIQKQPRISTCFETLTGKTPTRLHEFIKREADCWKD
jgi:uncharacterized protein YbjT (DUF2867 family)